MLPQPFQARLDKALKLNKWNSYIQRKFQLEKSIRRFWNLRHRAWARKVLHQEIARLRDLVNPLKE